MWRILLLALAASASDDQKTEHESESSRKVLGSSVVTSVSVIMDTGNGSKVFADAAGHPVSRPQIASDLPSPSAFLTPDRYEFYTFDDAGELVKRLMTLEEIQEIIATGDGDGFNVDLASGGFVPERRVNDVVNNVQNVLKEEMKTHRRPARPQLDTPDVSDSWSMILPAIFGNSGEDIRPEVGSGHVSTPDTVVVEPTTGGPAGNLITVRRTTSSSATTPTQRTTTTPVVTTTTATRRTTTTSPPVSTTTPVVTTTTSTTTTPVATTTTTPVVTTTTTTTTTQRTTTTSPPVSTTTPVLTTTTTTSAPTTNPPVKTTGPTLITIIKRLVTTTPSTPLDPVNVVTPATRTPPVQELTKENTRPIYHVSRRTTTPTTTTKSQDSSPEASRRTTTPTITTKSQDSSPEASRRTTTPPTTTKTQDSSPEASADVASHTVSPPETTTTTSPDSTTLLSSETLPSLLQLLNSYQQAIGGPTSTYSPLSTFFVVNDDRTTTDPPQSTTKFYEQLLLTSTNIFEINTELSDRKTTSFVDSTTITTTVEDSDKTTTDSEPVYVRLNTTEPSTTNNNLVESIEQLIAQAVATDHPLVPEDEEDVAKVNRTMLTTNKTMGELLKESATLASTLLDVETDSTTSVDTTTRDLLGDSVGSILSQVFGTGSTTLEYDESISTTNVPDFTRTSTPVEDVPHLINITIIKSDRFNQSKPAKADLSLELDYDQELEELRRNSTAAEQLSTSATTNKVPDLTTTEDIEPSVIITINEQNKNNWTLVSTLAPHGDPTTTPKTSTGHPIATIVQSPSPINLVPRPLQGFGLEDSTARLDSDIYQFVQLCNELAFGFWKSVTNGISTARSVATSPFAATSLLAMVFLGARGATSGEMNEILKLDDMVTFNPHLIFKNVSESIEVGADSGVATSVILRELYSDRSKGKLLGFYKERVRQFYEGLVEEVSFREVGDVIRRRTNLLVKKQTGGKIEEFLRDGSIVPKAPLAGISVTIFQTDCSQGSSEGRDGELHFVVLPSIRQRRLVPIPATVFRSGFLAGYESSLDATAAALGTGDQAISTILVLPGRQGVAAPGDGLARLERRLLQSAFRGGAWARLLRCLIPRPGVELQLPRFAHRSLINATRSLRAMGLHGLFDARRADLKGLNGAAHDLYLSDVLQVNEFATCGEERVSEETHHREVYPATVERKARKLEDEEEEVEDPLLDLPLPLRPRQARLPSEVPRLRFDRPFLYFVRHNPSGLILHIGRFHPRLLP